MRDLLTVRDLDRATIDKLLSRAREFAMGDGVGAAAGALVGLFFYDDSLRTRTGFEAAAARLGGRAFAVLGPRHTPVMSQPESVQDAVRSVAAYCDAICLRHPDAEVVAEVAALIDRPVINCGNGTDEHPTQALIDLYAISEFTGRLDGVRIALLGDLAGMRAAHSLASALGHYRDVHLRCVSPPGLELPARYADSYGAGGNSIEHLHQPALDGVDVVYVAGLPRRTTVPVSDATRTAFWITGEVVRALPPSVRILCPLPRVDEIQPEVDGTPNAGYFQQSAFGLPVRMAVLEHVLGDRAPLGGQCHTTRSGS